MKDDILIKDFVLGLRTPSGLSVCIALATAALSTAVAILAVPAFMTSPYGVLLADNNRDHHLFVTSELFQLQNSDRPVLAIIGASVTGASFGGPEAISSALAATPARDFHVVSLTTGRQSIIEHLLMLEHLPEDVPVYVVLGIGPSRFTFLTEDYLEAFNTSRFGIDSPLYVERTQEVGNVSRAMTGSTGLDHLRFYVPRLGEILPNFAQYVRGRTIERNYVQYVGRNNAAEAYQEHAKGIMARFEGPNMEQVLDGNYQRLRDLLDYVETRDNIRIILMEHPLRPEFVTDFLGQDRQEIHMARVRQIAEDANVPYFDAGTLAQAEDSEFYDWAHINSEDLQARLLDVMVDQFLQVYDE
ncbi:hypothetical protein L0666_17020 [Octadecabacter sp. CECT 8868]|uniref:hypothetical protein n=1 Tax=Octadecabacter algicola TaxID=2909342 RepID=UPI001F3D82A7|nr:hypothetical protein [Octadecabacter algicola]MCF2906699.1 hypothetical protein [Octadecabacter algicola]